MAFPVTSLVQRGQKKYLEYILLQSKTDSMAFAEAYRKKGWAVGVLVIAAIWFGMLVGVSFVATPAKFLAPSLSLPVALDVGRHTFAIFNRIEWVFLVALAVLVLAGARGWLNLTGLAIVAGLMIAETGWLLPLLDSRVGMIIAGQQPAPSNLHTIYIACEAAKLLGLIGVVIGAAWDIAGNRQNAAWQSAQPVLDPAGR